MKNICVKSSAFQSVVVGLCFFIATGLVVAIQGLPTPSAPPPPASAAGTERYLTHIATDKPIYRTGEKMYVRGTVLHADGHTPGTPAATVNFEIKGPRGETVTSGVSTIVDSITGFTWSIPASQAGGEYTVRIFHPFTGDAPAERKFEIRAYRAPRLKSQIVFVRDGYGPGDSVAANLHVDRAEGGFPVGAKVTAIARVDGAESWRGDTVIDGSGNAAAIFKLPAVIARGEGTLAMLIEDSGTVETAVKTIPILLQTLDLAIYPEGGDLIAGLPNRVYLEGRTPAQKPADMAGVIVDSTGKEAARFRTEHDGRGRFSFIPVKGESYSLHVSEPSGIKTSFPLPVVKESGAIIASTADVTPRLKDVVVRVAATTNGTYVIALSQHGREIVFKSVALQSKQATDITLPVPRNIDGVIVATVFDEQRTPLAERLLFRQPEHNLKVKITADRTDYVPGDKVSLRVATTDDAGKPVSAVVGLTVTDSSILEMIDKREQAPRLPIMVLLESDVKNLSDAHVYLDETNPKAPLATDLLLGTQGWRRFATRDTAKFLTANGNAARRVLTTRMITDAERAVALRSQVQTVAGVGFGVGAGVGPGVAGGRGGGGARGGAAAGVPVPAPPLLMAMAVAAPPPPPMAVPVAADRIDNFQFDLGMADARMEIVRQELAATVTVREYAHTLRPNWTADSRSDFAETVYWNAGIKTDASTGIANVSFNLSDSVTAFRVLADGFTADGSLGSSTSNVEAVRPFYIEPKLPLQVTSGDTIQLPIGIVNGTNRDLRSTQITASAVAGIRISPLTGNSDLGAKARTRRIMPIEIGREFSGNADFTLDARSGVYRDTVVRKIDVQPQGFPYEVSTGGILEPGGTKVFEFTIPNEVVRGSLASNVMVYPTPLASMTEALQSLLQQPYGCFEQTSSTSYPMVMAQQYFLTHSGVEPGLIEKTKGLLEASYKRLTGFESHTKGYEWFGADPGHEALTAYGLMQFTDMSKVRSVDKDMLDRTRAWLLARRDGNGGFSLSSKAVDSFGRAPVDTTNAYITWALLESGEKGLEKEVAAIKSSATASQDSYIVALGANILHATGDRDGARQLMDRLVRAQDTNGSIKGAVTSITRSGGDALAIETTALAVQAWLREAAYAPNVEKSLKWIVESNKNGRFGSTQSTILALRSIIAYDAAHARPKAPGRVVLSVDGKSFGAPMAFTAATQGAIVLPNFTAELGQGKHSVAIKMEEGSSMPFSMSVKYNSMLPDSAEQAQIRLQVNLKDREVREGGITEAVVSITNKSDQAIPTPVAIVGIPGGLEVRHDQLKELIKSGRIDAYEVIGREVVLYWRYIKGKDKFELPLSLIAAVPGSYTGPASRAYLYYTDEYKSWAPGLNVSILPLP